MYRKIFISLIAIVLIFALGIQLGFCAEGDTAKVISKLDEVLANQAEILKQFDGIKQELAIIKIRATR